jgi:hydrogenase maturation protease
VTTAIVCLGNELVGDDGAGVRVGRILSSIALPDSVVVIQRANLGLDLIELLAEHETLVVVDAMTSGRPPGSILTLDMQGASRMAGTPSCCHCIGIPEIVQLAQRMASNRPLSCVRIVAIEGGAMDTFGVGLSEAVRQALPDAVLEVLRAAGLGEGWRSAVEAAAERELSAQRGVMDVLR